MYRGPGIYDVKGSACFVLNVAPQRGEGEKREGVQISKNSSHNLWHHKFLAPCIVSWWRGNTFKNLVCLWSTAPPPAHAILALRMEFKMKLDPFQPPLVSPLKPHSVCLKSGAQTCDLKSFQEINPNWLFTINNTAKVTRNVKCRLVEKFPLPCVQPPKMLHCSLKANMPSLKRRDEACLAGKH